MDEVRGPTQDDQHREQADQEGEVEFPHGCTIILRILMDHRSPLAARMIEPISVSKRILDLELPGSLLSTFGKRWSVHVGWMDLYADGDPLTDPIHLVPDGWHLDRQ